MDMSVVRLRWEAHVIFFTAMALGVSAGLLRSAFVVALVAMLIGLDFALAAVLAGGPVPFASLGYAIAGYNAGLIELVFGAYLLARRRARPA